jgi:hypothetical protein
MYLLQSTFTGNSFVALLNLLLMETVSMDVVHCGPDPNPDRSFKMGGSGSGLGRKESTRQFVQIPCKNVRYLKGTVRRKQQGLNLYQTIDIRLLFTADPFF